MATSAAVATIPAAITVLVNATTGASIPTTWPYLVQVLMRTLRSGASAFGGYLLAVPVFTLDLSGDLELFHYDYFGPSIDTGFRVLSSATARHFTLSVEVAWAMLWVGTCANGENNTDRHLNDLDLLGVRDLKGVWGDRDYPLFALDRRHDDPVHQALRELDGSSRDLAHWAELCRACAASDGWPSAIYLPSRAFPRSRTSRPIRSQSSTTTRWKAQRSHPTR